LSYRRDIQKRAAVRFSFALETLQTAQYLRFMKNFGKPIFYEHHSWRGQTAPKGYFYFLFSFLLRNGSFVLRWRDRGNICTVLVVFGYKIALNKTLESFFPTSSKERKIRWFERPRPNHNNKMRSSLHLSLTCKETAYISNTLDS
jgi:hypothetical protein